MWISRNINYAGVFVCECFTGGHGSLCAVSACLEIKMANNQQRAINWQYWSCCLWRRGWCLLVMARFSTMLMGSCFPACVNGWRFMVAMAAPCPPRIREGYLCWQPSFSHQARKEDHTTCHSDWCLPWRHKLKGKEEKVMKRGWRKERAPRAGDIRRWSLTAASSAVNSSHWHSHTYTNHTCVVGALLCGAKLLYYTEDLLSVSLMWEGEESVSVIKYGSNEKEIKRCIVMSETWPLCILFIIWDVVRWASTVSGVTVIQPHHLWNGMLFAFLQVRYSTTAKYEFSIHASFDIRNDLFSYRGPALCNRQF